MDDVRTHARVAHPRCPFCHDDVRPDEPAKVGCSGCMAWHHEACWKEAGGCGACGLGRPAVAPRPAGKAHEAPPAGAARPDRARRAVLAVLGLVGALLLAGALVGGALLKRGAPPAADAWRAGFEAARDEAERTRWAREGAEAGDPGAMNLLGSRLATGTGCERDSREALRWGLRAAEAGHAEAMYGVAVLHETGDAGLRDEAAAARWYRRAVQAGDTLAGPRLAELLRRRPDLQDVR